MKYSFFFFLLSVCVHFNAQQASPALKLLTKKIGNDTTAFSELNSAGKLYQFTYPDTAILLHTKAVSLGKELKQDLLIAEADRQLAFDLYLMNNTTDAMPLYNEAMDLALKALTDETAPEKIKKANIILAGVNNDLGSLNSNLGRPDKALDYYRTALSYFEKTGNLNGEAAVTSNMGRIYVGMDNTVKALDLFFKAVKMNEKTGNDQFRSVNFGAIANCYCLIRSFDLGLKYTILSMELQEKAGDKRGKASSLGNIAKIYHMLKNKEKSLEYFKMAIEANKINGNRNSLAHAYYGLAELELDGGNLNESMNYLDLCSTECEATNDFSTLFHTFIMKSEIMLRKKDISATKRELDNALALSKKGQLSLTELKLIHTQYYQVYKLSGDNRQALFHYEKSILYQDSLNNKDRSNKSLKQHFKYEYEKQAAADSVAHAKENDIKSAELSRQSAELKAKKNQQYALFGGLGLVIIFAGFMFNRFKITQKQKIVIEHQKEEVEAAKDLVDVKQKEILDSIHYAKRIQQAHLPGEKYMTRHLPKL